MRVQVLNQYLFIILIQLDIDLNHLKLLVCWTWTATCSRGTSRPMQEPEKDWTKKTILGSDMLRTLRSYWSGEGEQQHVVVELVDHGRDLRKIELKKQFLVQICCAP